MGEMAISQGSVPNSLTWLRPLALALLLLAIAAARILRFNGMILHADEIWSIWQGFGSLPDVIRWTPYDWPPLYFILLDIWVELVGIQLVILRALSVFFFLIGASFFFRVVRKDTNQAAAWIATLVYGGMAYTIFLSTELRGYSVMLMALPAAWFFAQRLCGCRVRWWDALGFAFMAAVSIYATYTSALAFAMLAVYISWVRPRSWRRNARWFGLAGIFSALMILPIVFFILPTALERAEYAGGLPDSPPLVSVLSLYDNWFGYGAPVILALFVVGLLFLLRRRSVTRFGAFSLFWMLSLPILYVLTNRVVDLAQPKYASWVLVGIAAALGILLGRLPRLGKWAAVTGCLFMLLQPVPWERFYYKGPWNIPLYEYFAWLQKEWIAGDVLLMAKDHECGIPFNIHRSWNHMLETYFPKGISVVNSPVGHRRVWFVTADGSQSSPHWETLRRDYVERQFVGPPGCLFRLYEAPPDQEGLLYDNGMRFHGAQILKDGKATPPGFEPKLHEGEKLQLRLWWSVDAPVAQDYSVGTFLIGEGGSVLRELHGPPQLVYPERAAQETSRWLPGQVYIEERELEIPAPLLRQFTQLRQALYFWEAAAHRFVAPGVDELGMLTLFTIQIDSW